MNFVTIIVFLICFGLTAPSVYRVLRRKFCIIDCALIAFFAVQVLPIVVQLFYGVDDSIGTRINYYCAMTDENVSNAYFIFIVAVSFALFFFARRVSKKSTLNFKIIEKISLIIGKSRIIQTLLLIFIFLPLFLMLISPNPDIYFSYTSIWEIHLIGTESEQFFHDYFVFYSTNLALIAILLRYYSLRQKTLANVSIIIIGTIIMTWADGKRALFIILLLGILLIDILKGTYSNRLRFFIFKILSFVLIIVGFFAFYKNVVGKMEDSLFISDYTLYFSRMSCVKVAIYGELRGDMILEYRGQTLLFNLFFFIPSSIWKNKPSMFTQYFTQYALNFSEFPPWNMHVNIWTEMIANCGTVFGPVLGILLTLLIDKISRKQNSFITQISGLALVVLYYAFGFEIIVMIVYLIWIAALLLTALIRLLRGKNSNNLKVRKYKRIKRIRVVQEA